MRSPYAKERAWKTRRELEGIGIERRGKRKMSWLRLMRDQSGSIDDCLRVSQTYKQS